MIANIETVDRVELREVRYDSGLVEISCYVPEVIGGAGPILVGVVSRQPGGERNKWCFYGPTHKDRTPLKRVARQWLLDLGRAEIAKRSAFYNKGVTSV